MMTILQTYKRGEYYDIEVISYRYTPPRVNTWDSDVDFKGEEEIEYTVRIAESQEVVYNVFCDEEVIQLYKDWCKEDY